MCGLIGVIRKKKKKHTGQRVWQLYQDQKARGQSGFGFLSINNGVLTRVERSTTEDGIRSKLMKDSSDIILFHHRAPTSTPNTHRTTHPIVVQNEGLEHDYYVLHNGVITNCTTLRQKHARLGFDYTTAYQEKTVLEYVDGHTEMISGLTQRFNDSEAFAIELARYLEDKDKTVGTTGGVAFLALKVEKNSNRVVEVLFGNNHGRPLTETISKKWIEIKSEGGNPIQRMKIWSYDADLTLWDQPLPISPGYQQQPSHVGSGYNSNSIGYREKYNPPKPQSQVEGRLLRNQLYTEEDILNCGLSLSEFVSAHAPGQTNNSTLFVPRKYAGMNVSGRVRFSPEKLQLPLPSPYSCDLEHDTGSTNISEKELEKLENICRRAAEAELDMDDLDEELKAGAIETGDYKQRYQELECRREEAEQDLANLNVDETKIDEVYETCRDEIAYLRAKRVGTE